MLKVPSSLIVLVAFLPTVGVASFVFVRVLLVEVGPSLPEVSEIVPLLPGMIIVLESEGSKTVLVLVPPLV